MRAQVQDANAFHTVCSAFCWIYLESVWTKTAKELVVARSLSPTFSAPSFTSVSNGSIVCTLLECQDIPDIINQIPYTSSGSTQEIVHTALLSKMT